jgi:hypothetical protein
MPKKPRPPELLVTMPPLLIDLLEARGAHSDKSHGPYNYRQQVARRLELYEQLLLANDPRHTRGLAERHYELILDLLVDAHQLTAFQIQRLGGVLSGLPAFAQRARQTRIDPAELAATVNAYSFAEKLHLADAAQSRHAPSPRRAH